MFAFEECVKKESFFNYYEVEYVNETDYKIICYTFVYEPTQMSDTLIPTYLTKEYNTIRESHHNFCCFYKYEIRPLSTLRAPEMKVDIDHLNEGWGMRKYFLNADSVNTIPWDSIRKNNIVVKRIDFTSKEDWLKYDCVFTIP